MRKLGGRGQKLRILTIGFLPPPVGGMSVSFEIFCDIVAKRDDVDLQIINLSGMRQRNHLLRESLGLVARIWREADQSDVVTLYCTSNQIPSLALTTWIICCLQRKPLILRKAGGMCCRELGAVAGRVAEFVAKRVDLFIVQTKRQVEMCHRRGFPRVEWYPTSRIAGPLMANRVRCRRFVYVGHVRLSKGLDELITVAEDLPEPVEVHVYGPFFDGVDASVFQGRKRIFYKGVLAPDKVVGTMREYDALVLPSKALTEGYPGAILEALSVGMPVIATTVGGIPEIVDEECGILVQPGNKEALADAMHRLVADNVLYKRLRCGALEARERFLAEYWANWLVDQCARLGGNEMKNDH